MLNLLNNISLSKRILLLSILLLLLILIILYIFLKYLGYKYSGYNNLIKILNNVEGHEENYMNFGYWEDNIKTLTEANKNLCKKIFEKEEINKDEKILDVGCGYGEQDLYLINDINKDIKLDCIDINEKQVENFNNKISDEIKEKINYKVGSATDLEYSNNTFDKVYSIESAFHYKPRSKFFEESYRVLKKNGKLIIADILLNKNASKIPIKICKNFFDIPDENLKYIDEWKKDLQIVGYNVEIEDITENTFIPYFNYFLSHHTFNNKIIDTFTNVIVKYIIKHQPFKYVIAVAKK
jgi:ubiquinone/menaquinone biosynthesis C-methylase UbiE